MSQRLEHCFARLKQEGRAALITYMMACDPNQQQSEAILHALPAAGADIIELGMPFSDPMADGPVIQKAAIRALSSGAKLQQIFQMVRQFRQKHVDVPIVLMGYYNVVQHYHLSRFVSDAVEAGVDGLLLVDLPPEESAELDMLAADAGLALIGLIAPNTPNDRVKIVAEKSRGFLYYVSVAGVTGTKSPKAAETLQRLEEIKKIVDLPVAVGFGIKTPEQVAELAGSADGIVVGSALVNEIANGEEKVVSFVQSLACNL